MNIKRIVEMEVEKKDLQVGDKIQIGKDIWKVLDIKDGKALIWKTNNITFQYQWLIEIRIRTHNQIRWFFEH